jgi:murein DD-endopeptidase MepM/ murein hydrolase activator NlpD
MHARWFGAPRDGGRRKHAACDLIAPLGTDVFAIDDGYITEVTRDFYRGTSAIAVKHRSGFVVRYCEVLKDSIATMRKGDPVRAGQIIAQVGKMFRDSMLHLELYSGSDSGPLRSPSPPFHRRKDLIDPTLLLDRLRGQVMMCRGTVAADGSQA